MQIITQIRKRVTRVEAFPALDQPGRPREGSYAAVRFFLAKGCTEHHVPEFTLLVYDEFLFLVQLELRVFLMLLSGGELAVPIVEDHEPNFS